MMARSEAVSSVGDNMSVDNGSRKPRILLAASGSVAAVKFANLCHCFSEWAEVRAVATTASLHFIDREAIPKDIVLYTDDNEWSSWTKLGDSVLHIELRKWADIMVIAPLSANTLGKIAGGLCDNLLTCIVRAWDYSKPFFVAPAMNTFMWNNPFTERHLIAIDELGISLIPPVTKRLACGDYGNGAMAEPATIYSTVRLFYESKAQQGPEMATRGQGRGRRENEEPASSRNQAEFLAAMTNLVNTMQASAATTNQVMERMNGNDNGSGGNSAEGGPMTLATFREVNPPVFRGSTNPMEADDWFIAIERALQVQHVPEGQLVELAAYQLAGEAQQWWQGTYHLLQQGKGNNAITWEVFREEFYNKYFPNSVRQAKELELLQLRQGSMTVVAYTSKFEELCRFSRVCQGPLGDPEGYEEWKCMKYQDGLRDDIMRVVAPLEVKSFVELVNKSRVVEDCSRKNATTSTDRGGYHDRGGGARFFAPRGRNFKRGEYIQQSQRDRATFQGNNNNHQRRYGRQP